MSRTWWFCGRINFVSPFSYRLWQCGMAEKRKILYTYIDLSQKKESENFSMNRWEGEFSLPEYARIKAFVSLHKEFDADEAELTRRGNWNENHWRRYKEILTVFTKRESIKVRVSGLSDGRWNVRTEVIVIIWIKWRGWGPSHMWRPSVF